MSPALLALTLTGIAAVSMLVGIKGIRRGQSVIETRGPNTLMHYPAPLPWLRRKVTAARWVVWIGRLYSVAGLSCLMGAWFVWTTQEPPGGPSKTTCTTISHRVLTMYSEELRGGSTQTTLLSQGCISELRDAQGVRWFEIRSTPANRVLGQGFAHSRGEYERRGFTIKGVDGLGHQAALATPKAMSGPNSVLLYDDARGHHEIEINMRTLDAAGQNALIAGLSQSHRPPTKD